MSFPIELSRREALKASILLTLTAGASVDAGSSVAQQLSPNGRSLVAYFTRTGNTRVIAGQIRRALGADMFEIEPPSLIRKTTGRRSTKRKGSLKPATSRP